MSLLTKTSLLIALLFIAGCSEPPSSSQGNTNGADSAEYIKNLRLRLEDKTIGVINGVFEPKADLLLTNVGNKTVTSIKLFYELDAGRSYSDSAVIHRSVRITPNQKQTISLKLPAIKVKDPTLVIASRAKHKIEVLAVQTQ